MPLLKKKEFRKNKLLPGIGSDEDVFYCPITDEIFRDYDEFCARVILCNSMVWTCRYTGKSGLTYTEALESETHAKTLFKDFTTDLRIPVLFIASKTQRSSFHEMLEDVYGYVKDRYFVGENVQASFSGSKWLESHILQVIAPTAEKLKKVSKNGQAYYGPPATLYHYEVEQMNNKDKDLSEVMIVSSDQIRRKKKLGRDKLKLFLKQYVEQNELGVFIIKPSVLDKFGIHEVGFNQIFDGSLPTFEKSKKLVKNGKNVKQASLVPFLKKGKSDHDSSKSKSRVNGVAENGLSENTSNLIEKMRKRQEDFKQKKEDLKQKRAQERLKLKEENIKISLMLKEWYKPKEDLQLEDQKILPKLEPVCTEIPEEYMGDVFTILEFVQTFSKFLSVNSFFPGGLTLETLERALIQKEVAGPLIDIIQMFVSALFNIQVEETSQYNTKLDVHSDIKGRVYNDNVSLTVATHFATQASKWSSEYQGAPLIQLPLYTLTTSEILRLHLLSSGARLNDTGARWRYSFRGGYTSEDDPGLYFRLQYPHILKALALHSVTELPIGDVLKIIDCLMSQLLTYSEVRDLIDQLEKAKQVKQGHKKAQITERKQEQEYAADKLKIQTEYKDNNTELIVQLDKLNKDYEKRKAELERKMSKCITLANKHQVYLGQDRAFRKYFKLESIPAIVVNFEMDNPGSCYEECVQQNPELVNAGRSEIIAHLRKIQEETNTSDKENILADASKNSNLVNGELSPSMSVSNPDELLMCSSNADTCIVHSKTRPKDKWSFFNSSTQFTDLVNNLNIRGQLESELKQNIVTDQDYLTSIIEKSGNILNTLKVETSEENQEEDTEPKSKNTKSKGKQKYENATLGYPKELSTALILQYVVVENILDLEEKIFAGMLGSLKIKDRVAWRTSLANHNYDFDKKLKLDLKLNIKIKGSSESSRSSTPDITPEYQDPGIFLGSSSEMQTESLKESDPTDMDDQRVIISSLAIALAQVAEGVDSRFLKKPLGNVGNRNDPKIKSDILEQWEISLLASTSYCQILLHYSTLDNSVVWSRSALLARCMVCRKQRDSENMLICDNCNRGQHLYCHKPKLRSVPKGDWFCITCRKQKEAEEKLKNPSPEIKKLRRIFVEEENEEDSSQPSSDSVENVPLSKRKLRTKKKRKLSVDTGTGSENSDIVPKKRRRISKKKPVPIIEDDEAETSDKSEMEVDDSKPDNDESFEQSEKEEEAEEENEEEQDENEDEQDENDDTEQSDAESDETNASDNENVETEESEMKDELTNGGEECEDSEMVTEDSIKDNSKKLQNGDLSGDEAVTGDEQAVEVCEKCGVGGTLLCCDNCPELYHLECANPPLRRVPRGEWFCHKCKSSKKKEDTDDDWYMGHSVVQRSGLLQNQRRCAARARNSIYGFAKILPRISKYEDNSRRSIRRDDLPLNNAQLQELLTDVMKQDFAWPFLRPVNKHEVPDYYEIVENPMDFGTIKYKLNMGTYKYDADLMIDVSLMFENCKLYNNSEDEVFQCGLKMLEYFVNKCQELGLQVPHAIQTREVLLDEAPANSNSDVEDMHVE